MTDATSETSTTSASLFDDVGPPSVALGSSIGDGGLEVETPGTINPSAGQLLQQLREKADVSVQNLAATLKVSPSALTALEADHYAALPDMVFARALAASVCRTLKVDAAPILQSMPQIPVPKGPVGPSVGLNLPMNRPVDLRRPLGWLKSPSYLLGLGIVVAILVVLNWTWVVNTVGQWTDGYSTPQVAGATPVVAQVASGVTAPAAPNPTQAGVIDAGANTGMVTTEVIPGTLATLALSLSATAASWVEVTDATGNSILKKQLEKGESTSLAVPPDAKLVIGNAAATVLSVNGKPVDLLPYTVANIARVSIK